jgi:hypothetical protein
MYPDHLLLPTMPRSATAAAGPLAVLAAGAHQKCWKHKPRAIRF